MKKFIALLLSMLLVLSMTGCMESAVTEEIYSYEAESEIRSLDIQLGAADFSIVAGDAVKLETNLKYLSVSEKNGVLKLVDEKTVGVTYDGPVLKLYLPADMVFEQVSISTGAARLTAESLSAEVLKLKLGAGAVEIASLNAAEYADVEGGAGKVTVKGGKINNLELDMGVGELNLTAQLLGQSDLTFGVGKSDVTLLGNRDDYKLEVEKALGTVTVDGEVIQEFTTTGTGENRVQIEGGVGAVNLKFE